MLTLQIVKHSEATSFDIDRAIAIKQVAWPYPKDSQIQWMRDNLTADDTHVFLYDDGNECDIAYLNMINIRVIINGISTLCVGIGNVCSARKGGGKCLIIKINELIVENHIPAILFCKSSLVGFYRKFNWKLISPERVTLNHHINDINTMVFNMPMQSILEYDGNLF
ncbi:MAG: hypothetical protein ACI391_06415 [Muribaculaceae bacterium]